MTITIARAVSRTNITLHILKCVTVLNQDTLQHFPPGSASTLFSQTKMHVTNRLVRLNCHPCADALRYLYLYRISTVCILVSDGGQAWVHAYLFIIQRPHIYYFNWAHCGVVGWGTAFQVEISRDRIAVGLSGILTYFFRPHYGPGVDALYNTKECQGCHLGIKATVCRADNFIAFLSSLSKNSGTLNFLEH